MMVLIIMIVVDDGVNFESSEDWIEIVSHVKLINIWD